MNIGIDIDNVISNFDDTLFEEYLKHDKELRNTGIINKNANYIRRGMFDWTEEEEKNFYYSNIERIAKTLKPLNDAPFYIKKLKDDRHKIFIISGRNNGEYEDPYSLTKEWLEKYNIFYDELILTDAYDSHHKTQICLEKSIDLMIEDSSRICLDLINNNINVFKMNTKFNQNEDNLIRVSNWKEIYEKISNFDSKKINVILDTDTYNECDDQFAISYLLNSQDRFNIEAITIAPFQNKRDTEHDSGINKSYNEAKTICDFCNFDTNKIYKGATNYISCGYNFKNDAVSKIIEIARKNNKTFILGIGAITNIALAIKFAPDIIDKIEIIWLGGHTLFHKDNTHEANFKDIDAIKIVFESKVKLTIIPCKGVASNLITTCAELFQNIYGKSYLCNYLYDCFKYNVDDRNITRWPLWDISVIAYMINKDWFTTFDINCPNINSDTSYEFPTNNHIITMVSYLDSNKIYKDFFGKLVN